MKRDLVTRERLNELGITYDPETGAFARNGKVLDLAPMPAGHIVISIDCRPYSAHRLAWFVMTGQWPAGEIRHVNGHRADNSWINLRLSTASQRAQRRRKPNSTGRRGVRLTKAGNFRASIYVRGHTFNLGTFSTLEAAGEAYANAAVANYGEGARTQ